MNTENVSRLLLFASELAKSGAISKNGSVIFKYLIVNGDSRVLELLNQSNENDEYHILEKVRELIIDEAERLHASLFSGCSLALAKSVFS